MSTFYVPSRRRGRDYNRFCCRAPIREGWGTRLVHAESVARHSSVRRWPYQRKQWRLLDIQTLTYPISWLTGRHPWE